MDRNTLTKRTEEQAVEPSPFDHPSASKVADSRSQGTDSVRRTWSSEGEAGRHFRTKAQRIGALNPPPVQPRLDRIAEQAREHPEWRFYTLAHHLDVAMLERAFWSLNPKSAAGVDRVTWQQFKHDLELNLEVLHEKLVNKTYQPQPVVRHWIPKGDGKNKFRPLGIPVDQPFGRCPKTRSWPRPWRCCWSKSTNRTSTISPLASVLVEAATRHHTICVKGC